MGHFEGRTQWVPHRLLVSGLFIPGELGGSWELSPAAPFSTEVPTGTRPFHISQTSASPCRATSFPKGIEGNYLPHGDIGDSHGGHSARVFRGQREMAEGTSRQWNGTGIGDRILCGWRFPLLTGKCGTEAPGQIL